MSDIHSCRIQEIAWSTHMHIDTALNRVECSKHALPSAKPEHGSAACQRGGEPAAMQENELVSVVPQCEFK